MDKKYKKDLKRKRKELIHLIDLTNDAIRDHKSRDKRHEALIYKFIKYYLEEELGDWEVLVGPRESSHIPAYLKEWQA